MDVNISENVLEKLSNLYKLKKDEVKKILSTPPQSAVIRVNINLININDAIEVCKSFLKNCDTHYSVKIHPQIKDALIIEPKNFENKPEPLQKEIIVDSSCGTAVLRGADIFVPGVLAANSNVVAGDLVSVYCDVKKKCRKGFTKHFDGEKFYLGNGKALFSRWQLFEENDVDKNDVCGVAIKMGESKFNLPSFHNLQPDLFFPQNLPSIIVGHLLDIEENDLVLDMCAAPGGKTSHLATLLRKGKLISIDKTQNKVDRIKENLRKLKLNNVECHCYDSTKILCNEDENESDENGPPFPSSTFDRILLDPPCSGLGQRPQLRYTFSDKELASYPILQKKFFKQAVPLLKTGGTLVFSTCTLCPEENEAQVAWALQSFSDLSLVEQEIRIGSIGLAGYGLSDEQREKVQRFDAVFNNYTRTDIYNDSIGFFIAKFVKRER
ncbi:tRNA (cytosine(72)-C(5))-methyltransferase NSUN6-like [Clytia hemisphaerica]|uniref:tRNA (cytosine(72)-C(5))-methyltransferase NSUN6-like n=1 Tax=Clytia hemisphaerica TaxID=252671 RepID=UPI0034D4032D